MKRNVVKRTYLATYIGRGEFYTGLETGCKVRVEEEVVTYTHDGARHAVVRLSAQRVEGSAWLSLYDSVADLTDIEEEAA
jgi:hypothetical protein